MKHTILATLVLGGILTSIGAVGLTRGNAAAQLVPSPESLRFRLVGDEPIAGPDGQSIVTGWKVLVFMDQRTSRCYVTFTQGTAAAMGSEIPCASR